MANEADGKRFGGIWGSRWMLYGPVIGIGLLIAGGGWFGWKEYERRRLAAVESAKPVPAPDVIVQSFQGRIRAVKVVQVPAPVAGTMESLEVEDGQEVFEGQLLGKIRNTAIELAKQKSLEDLEANKTKLANIESQLMAARLEASRASSDLARVRSEYESAARHYETQQKLFREGAVARRVYEKAEAEYQRLIEESKGSEEAGKRADTRVANMQAGVEEARKKLTEKIDEIEESDAELTSGEVKAPVGGLLIGHKKEAGDEVTRDVADLFEIATDLTAMEVVVELPGVVAAKIAAGSNAFVQITEGGASPLNGKVREVKDSIAYVEFLSPSPAIKPGMSAQVRFLN